MEQTKATIRRPHQAAPGGVAVQAAGLGLKSPRITAYQGVDLDLAAGQAHAILAENKAGKTELLLTIAGRMLATSGELVVDGISGRNLKGLAQIRRLSGLGWFENVNELEGVVKVRTCVSAELGLAGKKSGRAATEAYLEQWGLADVAGECLGDLGRVDFVRLGVALGMAADPRLLVVDDIERDLTEQQSLALADELRQLAASRGTTVVCGICDYGIARRFDSVTCISDEALAQLRAAEGASTEVSPGARHAAVVATGAQHTTDEVGAAHSAQDAAHSAQAATDTTQSLREVA